MTVHFRFDISYARLPDRFFARLPPTPVSAPKLVKLNRQLAADLDLDAEWLASPEALRFRPETMFLAVIKPLACAAERFWTGQRSPPSSRASPPTSCALNVTVACVTVGHLEPAPRRSGTPGCFRKQDRRFTP
jgi:hypothetical protein